MITLFTDPSGGRRTMVAPFGEVRPTATAGSPAYRRLGLDEYPELSSVDPLACADDVDLEALKGLVVVLPQRLDARSTRELFSTTSLVPRHGTSIMRVAHQMFEVGNRATDDKLLVSEPLARVLLAHHGGSHRIRSINDALDIVGGGRRRRKVAGELRGIFADLLDKSLFCLMPV